jgi:hypothetical protein
MERTMKARSCQVDPARVFLALFAVLVAALVFVFTVNF